MKKILTLGILALGISAAPAMADNHEGGDKSHKRGGMFKTLDKDGDGAISRAEFDAKHAEMFKEMDKDGNGSISQEEAKAHHEARKDKRKDRMEKRKDKREKPSED